jgi:hypothetical protein
VATPSKKFLTALLKIAQEVPNLEKENKNAYGKYSYVSIDDYYSKVAKIAHNNGINWVIKENVVQLLGNAIQFSYGFDVYSSDGEMVENFTAFSVIHPIQGAQSSGSAASYAEKLFMRTVFKCRTGEPDADDTDPDAINKASAAAIAKKFAPAKSSAPTKQGVSKTITEEALEAGEKNVEGEIILNQRKIFGEEGSSDLGVMIAVEAAKIFALECKTENQLKRFKSRNDDVWQAVRDADPAAYKEIATALTNQMNKIKEAA